MVECKGVLNWDAIKTFPELQRYEDAVNGTSYEVLIIPKSPKNLKNSQGYDISVLGFLFDREVWSYAELGRWSGNAGFCHRANDWRDRMSGESANLSSGNGRRPNVELDWAIATQEVRGPRKSYFKESSFSEIEYWDTSR